MSVILTNRDITSIKSGMIAHGVNCQATMGAGVAKALYQRWPMVKQQYMKIHKDDMRLGKVQWVQATPDVLIANCFTQEFFGPGDKKYASLDAIEMCLTKVFIEARMNAFDNIFIPPIGCGLGGLDFNKDLKPLLIKLNSQFKIGITVCDINLHSN